MYEDWTAEPWATPFYDVKSLTMVSLHDGDGELAVVLEDTMGAERTRWRVRFRGAAAYRNIKDEFRLGLWARREALGGPEGWSWLVTHSDWLGAFRAEEPCVDVHAEGAKHYLLVTEDDVIEVFTPEEPIIEDLGPSRTCR